jgi:hypothetical protein
MRNTRKYSRALHNLAVADDSRKTAGHDKAEMDSESKPVGVVSCIPLSSRETPTVVPTSNTPTLGHDASSYEKIPVTSRSTPHTMRTSAEEMPADNATLQEGPPMSPAWTPAELYHHPDASANQPPYLSGSVISPHQELPADYVPHFEMAADTPEKLHSKINNSHSEMAGSQSPSTTRDATSTTISTGTGVVVMRAPDEELAWLEAEEEKIRKRKSELTRLGGRS